MKEMNAVVDGLKSASVPAFGDFKVVAVRDYSASVRKTAEGKTQALDIPKCNCVRPSGTEPKLKIYYSIKAENEKAAQTALEKAKTAVSELLERVKK